MLQNKKIRLNKTRGLLLLIVLAALACAIAAAVLLRAQFTEEPAYESMKDFLLSKYAKVGVSAWSDYAQFNFDELCSFAHTIALVTPLDDLTEENSYGIKEKGDKYYGAHSLREVRALTYFKNKREFGETFQIAEKCVLDNGALIMEEDCWPMQRGAVYLVFLINSGYGAPLSISADNGKYDITHLPLNNRLPLLLQALDAFDLLDPKCSVVTSGRLEEILASKRGYGWAGEEYPRIDAETDWKEISAYTAYTSPAYRLNIQYAEGEDGMLYKYGRYIYYQ